MAREPTSVGRTAAPWRGDVLSGGARARTKRLRRAGTVAACAIAAAVSCLSAATSAQRGTGVSGAASVSLARVAPDLHARLVGLERAEGVLFGALSTGSGHIDEVDVLRRMMERIDRRRDVSGEDAEAERGFATLGAQAADVVRRAHAFQRELVAAFVSLPAAERKAALDALVGNYRRGPAGRTLPDVPKDMTILYDHPYTSFVPPQPPETEPHRELAYPRLTAFLWSAHWYELAVLEPLGDVDEADARAQGLAMVAERFARKLAPGGAPTELPLAPAIAPGLVAVHEHAAAILDNLDMMQDVLTDVLVHGGVPDRRGAVNEVVRQFTTREFRCVQTDEWIVVALRHSIFAQGGFALRSMDGYERNAFFGGHSQHYAARRLPPPCDPE
jgi:hypothetical protein